MFLICSVKPECILAEDQDWSVAESRAMRVRLDTLRTLGSPACLSRKTERTAECWRTWDDARSTTMQNNATYYRQRAAEVRRRADELKHNECRELLDQVARAFEHLAACLEDREVRFREAIAHQ